MNKAASGSLHIDFLLQDNRILLELWDDGKGLDIAKIKNTLGEEVIQSNPSEEEIAQAIFQSGLSTAENLSQISGQGVGLDAVKFLVEGLGGSINVSLKEESTPSKDDKRPFSLQISLPQNIFLLSNNKNTKAA